MEQSKSKAIIEALTHSNYIEKEYSLKGLRQSIRAFEYLDDILFGLGIIKSGNILTAHGIMMDGLMPKGYKPGVFRNCAVTIGGRIYPDIGPDRIEEQVEEWGEKVCCKTNSIDIVKLHIEFEKIHPFVDGNGRMGRILMLLRELQCGSELTVIHEGKEQFEYYEWFSR